MATTEIHSITATPEKALGYAMANKITEITDETLIHEDCPHRIINRDGKKYVEYITMTTYLNCNRFDPMETYRALRKNGQDKFRKGGVGAKKGEPLMYHLHQSFHGREVDYRTANNIGFQLAQEVFEGFAVTIATHTNGDNIHNHFIISAWNIEGRKWNDCIATIRKIRQVSDRLCREHGLSVLEKTAHMGLVRYKDSSGKTRMFEPTERKCALISQRNAGAICADDVNSFRNTQSYQTMTSLKINHRTMIRQDIDKLIPLCSSYDELLLRLEDLGYTIRARKKNSDWMKHISFQPPTAGKATREDKIGDGTFYLRENLTAYFAQQTRNEITSAQKVTHGEDIPCFDHYTYGETDIDKIDILWRKSPMPQGGFDIIPRPPLEQKLIASIKADHAQVLGLIDTHTLHRLIAQQRSGAGLAQRCEEILVARIQNSFRCLQYTEQHMLYSVRQMKELYQANRQSLEDFSSQYRKLHAAFLRLKAQYPTYEKIPDYEAKLQTCAAHIAAATHRQQELENCIQTYERIDQENTRQHENHNKPKRTKDPQRS